LLKDEFKIGNGGIMKYVLSVVSKTDKPVSE